MFESSKEIRKLQNKLVEYRQKQLKIIYRSPWTLPNRVKNFFLISSHGRFPELNEERDDINFNNNAKFFFRIPEGVRLFFPTLGQGCLALAGTWTEKRLWEMLAAKKSSIFFEPLHNKSQKINPPQNEHDTKIQNFLTETCLYEGGDLFPNFIIEFDETGNDMFDVFAPIDPGRDDVYLARNGWSATVKGGEINSLLSWPLSKIVDFLKTKTFRKEDQVLDIVLSCCNVPFSCRKNRELEKLVRRQWEVLMVEGKQKMEAARKQHTGMLTRGKALQKKIWGVPPPDETNIDEEEGRSGLFEFEDPSWESRPLRDLLDTTQKHVFTKNNCVCTEPCKDGKCKVEPTLCFGREEDDVEICKNDKEDNSWGKWFRSFSGFKGSSEHNTTSMDTSQ